MASKHLSFLANSKQLHNNESLYEPQECTQDVWESYDKLSQSFSNSWLIVSQQIQGESLRLDYACAHKETIKGTSKHSSTFRLKKQITVVTVFIHDYLLPAKLCQVKG